MLPRPPSSTPPPYTTLFRSDLVEQAARPRPHHQDAVGQPHGFVDIRSEEHTSELQSPVQLVCRPLLEKTNCRPRPLRSDRRHNVPPAPDESSARRICVFNDTTSTEIYTLSLPDALPI